MAGRKGGAGKVPAGSKFKSARQMRFLYARAPKAAKKWEDGRKTLKSDWRGTRGSTSVGRALKRRKP